MKHTRRILGLFVLFAGACTSDTPNPPAMTGGMGGASGMGGAGVGGAAGLGGAAGVAGAAGLGGMGGMPAVDAGPDAEIDAGDVWMEPPYVEGLYDGPRLLSEAGLYSDVPAGVLAEGVVEYQPLGQLWSDGAAKKRWLKLPPNTVINTEDMDHWVFPNDTKVFKEFSRDGKRIETRIIWKRGPDDWPMVSYLWNPEQTEAYAAPNGKVDAAGTQHDVPDQQLCGKCHAGPGDLLLGVSALQLSHPGPGLTLDMLAVQGLLSDPPVTPIALPGDEVVQKGLAYLHANCGHCHNPEQKLADRYISVYFQQRVDWLATLEDTVTYKSLVTDKMSPLWIDAVLKRMATRDGGQHQMPLVATNEVDTEGLAAVTAFMDRLREDVPALPTPTTTGGTCPNPQALFDLFVEAGCASSRCHGQGSAGDIAYGTAQQLHDSLVGKPASTAMSDVACSEVGLARVEPGVPERSLLWLKLQPGPPCGRIMPPMYELPEEIRDAFRDWILACEPVE